MVIESRLGRGEYVRLIFFRRFTSTVFYLFALIGAMLTAYVFTGGGGGMLAFIGWVPLLIYAVLSIVHGLLSSRGPNRPFLQQTRYDFNEQGIRVSNRLGEGEISWRDVKLARKLVGCYVIDLQSGQFFAFPTTAVRQPESLEKMFRERIQPQLAI